LAFAAFGSSGNVQRRLAAILAADVVGYSRLMGDDEEGTRAVLNRHRDELIDPEINTHPGRLVKTTGDGLLIEFGSVVDAVRCAIEMQRGMAARNANIPEDRQMLFRVGINLGDVIVEGDDIHGDGVNVAARLEGLAEPGGICVSGKVHDEVRNRLDIAFEDLGPREVKNIAEPVPVWRARLEATVDASGVNVAAPVPGFGGKPAIAVLPFDNMSGDAEQEYFADGIAEDILTRLAMWGWIPVIARNSSFVYKGRSVDVKEVGRTLGARYVLEGSVRKAANRVRVTGQLIDAETGHHVWAERYDRVLEDIFDLQDEITESVVAALEPAVGKAEMSRARQRTPDDLDAWDLCQRAMWHFNRVTREDFAIADELYRRAIERDPGSALPLTGIAIIRIVEALLTWAANPAEALSEGYRFAREAVSLDEMGPSANAVLGYANAYMRQFDAAISSAERSIDLNPSNALGYHALGVARMFNGEPREAVEAIERAVRISPEDSWLPVWLSTLSACHYLARDYEKAVEVARLATQRAPHYPIAQRSMANALAQLGRLDEARAALASFLELSPNYTIETAQRSVVFRDASIYEHYHEGLRKAGWDG